ncbi:hypothetical protein HN51_039676, partial [Arachis hypogaea]
MGITVIDSMLPSLHPLPLSTAVVHRCSFPNSKVRVKLRSRCVPPLPSAVAVQSFRKRVLSMEFSTPEGGSNSTLINSNEGNEELSVTEVVTQEGSKVDKITDVMVTRKNELELRHE